MRPDLESLPSRLKSLKIDDRGYPVPWFVAYVDGKPEFRAADACKYRDAVRFRLCWVCGEKLGARMTFVIGPMCGINRVSSEPPSHLECAQWSARNCPFLANKNKKRREDEVINADNFKENCAGMAIARNPGVTLLWTTRSYVPFNDGKGGMLLKVGDPESIEYYASGRIATRAEIDTSIETGLPILEEAARADGGRAMDALALMRRRFESLLPA